MAKAEAKTKTTEVSVDDFIAAVADERRRGEAAVIDAMLRHVTGEQPRMWGPSIIGYGSYHYRYDSGREGDACRIGFSPRKAQLVIYIVPYLEGTDKAAMDALLDRLGPHSLGQSCLYIKRLDKVDAAVLEEIAALSWRLMADKYPG